MQLNIIVIIIVIINLTENGLSPGGSGYYARTYEVNMTKIT